MRGQFRLIVQGGRMSEDIVTRLREQAVCTRSECDDCDLHRNAADKIERLREELEIYKTLYAEEIVGKAVRGE